MSERKIEACSVGKETGTECHKKSYTRLENVFNIASLSPSEIDLLSLRSGVSSELIYTVCEHHKTLFLNKYETYQTSCFDPFNCHTKKITKSLRNVSINFSQNINKIPNCKKCTPGQKICNVCRNKVEKYVSELDEETELNEDKASETDSDEAISNLEISVSKEETLADINSSLQNIGESPLKFHAVPSHSIASYTKRKIESAYSTLKTKVSKVVEKELSGESRSEDIVQKANDMDILIELIKTKLNTITTTREKIQILTLVPVSWGRKKVCEEFKVSEFAVRKSRELLREKGIIAMPEPRRGFSIHENVIETVKNFFQSDEYSRIMPGSKDKVSIAKNEYMLKRLLLGNLNELYAAFKSEYPDIKIGFSKFCMLRPKWCVLAGSSGTHSVCVCTIHQNVMLLLHACAIEENYNDLINQLVCSKDNRNCMLRHCSQCPSNENLRKFIIEKFEEWDPSDEVTYSSWISTDRTQQVQFTVSFEEYLIILMRSLEVLLPHSYITKVQARYLKDSKENLKLDTAIILLDFSENYSFVIQDEVQGYHWTCNSCSLHPVVIYTSDESSNMITSSLCMLSDDLEHDVGFVYETQKMIIKYLKENFPSVKKIHYFSDGCAAQYKNCKNFINLCHHKKDFHLTATWTFFATSHGKSPCDGIGGTVKRLASKASLQMGPGNTIDSVEKLLAFCQTKIEGIKFWLIKKETLSLARRQLEDRFSKAKTVPGTRSFHHFVPISEDAIGTKRVSNDNLCSIFHFSGNPYLVMISDISVHNYIACIYDNQWFFGLVLSKHEDEGDIKIKFLHPQGPAPSFYWPSKEDICFIPICNIIACVKPPITKGSGRVYYFEENDIVHIQQQCAILLKKISHT